MVVVVYTQLQIQNYTNMTVQELINKLQEIEDKSIDVCIYMDEIGAVDIAGISNYKDYIELY